MRPALLASVLCMLLLACQACALEITGVEFYPQNPSVESGFIVVTRVSYNGSTRVSWMVPESCAEPVETCFGQFPRSGNAFVCYFSKIDPDASCGPPPFDTPASVYNFVVNAIDGSGSVAQSTSQIATGSVPFNVYIQLTNDTVKMQVFQYMDAVTYKIYDLGMSELTSGSLQRNEYGTFIGDIPYDENYRFIVFSGTGASGPAGTAVTIPQQETEEEAKRTYNIVADDVKVYDAVVKQGKSFQYRGSRITNRGDTLVEGLSVEVPEALRKYLRITLENSTLEPNRSAPMTVEVVNLQGHLEISTTATVKAGEQKVGEVDINIKVSVLAGETATAREPPTAMPSILKGEYIIRETSETVRIRNNDESPILIYNYTAPDLVSIISSVSLPDEEIAPGSTGDIVITFNPTSSGERMGILTLETDSGRANIFIDVTFHTNISDRISAARSGLDGAISGLSESQKGSLSDITQDIESDLSSAQSSFDMGNYALADSKVDSALAKVSLVESVARVLKGQTPGTAACDCDMSGECEEGCWCDPDCGGSGGGGVDMTMIIIAAVVALGALGAWYYFKKVRRSGWEGEVEDEF
jgi:hypothetical protein